MSNDAPNTSKPAASVKMAAVKLNKNYRPMGDVEIVGYMRPAKLVKDTTGRMVEERAAEFISGEMAPPPFPGVGFDGKIWAGTTIRLPEDEAKRIHRSGIATRDFD